MLAFGADAFADDDWPPFGRRFILYPAAVCESQGSAEKIATLLLEKGALVAWHYLTHDDSCKFNLQSFWVLRTVAVSGSYQVVEILCDGKTQYLVTNQETRGFIPIWLPARNSKGGARASFLF